jgi:kumamolisin
MAKPGSSEPSRGAAKIVPGSDRPPIPGAQNPQPVSPDEAITVTVRLRPASPENAARVYSRGPRRKSGKPLTRAQLSALVSASPDDASAVEAFAHSAGLTVVQIDLPRRSIMLRGPARVVQKAFGVTLQRVSTPQGSFRQRTGSVTIPAPLADVVTGVFGLDDRPQARTHFRIHRQAAAAPATSFSAPTLGGVYAFPAGATGAGQCIALIELGGGYKAADLQTYFSGLSLSEPTVSPIGVDGAQNAPTGSADGPDGEVMLDIEVAGSLAPAATIAVYFAPNTDQGFLDAVTTAVHDSTHNPTVMSISWGGPESTWTAQAQQAMDEAFAEAVALGLAVCVAAGDNGATDGVSDGTLHVDFPASSPNAIGCGGTSLSVTGGQPAETVWNDLSSNEGATGGGFSVTFPTPSWQTTAVAPFKQTGRGVPDVSADADPETGYNVVVDGSSFVLGGTSAVAPLWAALIACCQQASGKRLTDLVSRLYAVKAGFRDITQGGNGGFNAVAGWDPCTGLGVQVGSALLTAVWSSA